jgi:hypothetical protein
MVKTVFALALMASSGTALAYQQQPVPTEEAAEAVDPVVEADAAEQPAADLPVEPAADVPAEPAEAEEADEAEAEEVQVSAEDDYRAAARAFTKCRQRAHLSGGTAAVAASCATQRKRMLAAKEALREER